VVLFFEKPALSPSKGAVTKKIWFYQLNLDRNLGKTNPLNENDLADFVKLQKSKADSENSWTVEVDSRVDSGGTLQRALTDTYDLSVKNPHKQADSVLRDPQTILDEMKSLDEENAKILKTIKGLL